MTSPPYNQGKAYEHWVPIDQYLQEQSQIIAESCRILHEQGSICWQVGNFVEHGEVYLLDILYYF